MTRVTLNPTVSHVTSTGSMGATGYALRSPSITEWKGIVRVSAWLGSSMMFNGLNLKYIFIFFNKKHDMYICIAYAYSIYSHCMHTVNYMHTDMK